MKEIGGKDLDKIFYPSQVFRAFSKVDIVKDSAPEEIELEEIPYYQRKESRSSFGPHDWIEFDQREVIEFLRDWVKEKKIETKIWTPVIPQEIVREFIPKAYKFKVVIEESYGCSLTVGRTLEGIPIKRPARSWDILICDNSEVIPNEWRSWEPLSYQRFRYLRAGLEGDRVKHLIIRDAALNPLPGWQRKQLEGRIQNIPVDVTEPFQLWILVENMEIVLTKNSRFLTWITQGFV